MKKFIVIFSVLVMLLAIIGCSDDNDKTSSPTGVDFTDDDFFDQLDYYVAIAVDEEESALMIMSKIAVTSSELMINNVNVDIQNSWIEMPYESELPFALYLDESVLPEALTLAPGTVMNFKLKINGVNINNSITVAFIPQIEEMAFDVTKDFKLSWALEANPMQQIATLYGASMLMDYEEFYVDKQLNGEARSYTFSKSNYSDFVETGVDWYEYSVDAINYKLSAKAMFMSLSSSYIESDYGYRTNNKFNRVSRVIRVLSK